MRILVIGNGGREHAIIEKLIEENQSLKIYCTPGISAIEDKIQNIDISSTDISGLIDFVKAEDIFLTIVGPEAPLVNGIVDEFEFHNLKIFGPSKKAARLEGSKAFSKAIMKKYNVPTAAYETFTSYNDAKNYLSSIKTFPIVIKASGLAAGKGVVIPKSKEEALFELKEIMADHKFGDAGSEIVIEAFLEGEEASVFAICDGENFVCLSPAQDHKRIGEGDTGKNTGGMGAYAPAPLITKDIFDDIKNKIIEPTLKGMINEGSPYKGVLFIGLMIKGRAINVVEYNCRFGDPETQVVLPLLDESLLNIIQDSVNGKIKNRTLKFKDKSAMTVVLSSGGYPDDYEKGYTITGLEKIDSSNIIFSGVKKENAKLKTNGGRVLNVVSISENLEDAAKKIYNDINKINFENMYYRKDIGHRVLKK
jgi:phosphoribosylamine---glycine ligase